MASASVGKYVNTKHSNPPRHDTANHGRSSTRDRIAAAARLPQKPSGAFGHANAASWLAPSSTNTLNAKNVSESDTQAAALTEDDAASYDHFADSVFSDSEDTIRSTFNALDLHQQRAYPEDQSSRDHEHEQEMNVRQTMLMTQPLLPGTSSESHRLGTTQRLSAVNPPLVISAMQTLENLKLQKEFQNQRRHFPTFNQSQSHTSGRFSPSMPKQHSFGGHNGSQSHLQPDLPVGEHIEEPQELPRLQQPEGIFDINDHKLARHGQGMSMQPLARERTSGAFHSTSSIDPATNDNEIDDSSTVRPLEDLTDMAQRAGRSSSADPSPLGEMASRGMLPESASSRETALQNATHKREAVEHVPSSSGLLHVTEELDFDPKVLSQMDYATLRNQPFEDDQKATDPLQDEIKKDDSLETRLKHFASQTSACQAQFFAGLSIMDWEEAGEWFIQRFGEIVKNSMEFRKERRQISRRFEDEISTREEQVRAKTEHLAGQRARLLTGSQSLMNGQGNTNA